MAQYLIEFTNSTETVEAVKVVRDNSWIDFYDSSNRIVFSAAVADVICYRRTEADTDA